MITDNLETTLRIQKNDYGYATITKEGEGFRVRRHTVEPEKCGKYEFTIQEGWVVATEEEAMEIAKSRSNSERQKAPARKGGGRKENTMSYVSEKVEAWWRAHGGRPVPDDAAESVTKWWRRFVDRVMSGIDGTLELLFEEGEEACEGVTIHAYRTPEAHAADNGDGETLYEHSAVVAAIITGLAMHDVAVRAEWKENIK